MPATVRALLCLSLLAASACDERTRSSPAQQRDLLVFEDAGPTPAHTDWLFTGRNWKSFANGPTADIAASLTACGAKELEVVDGGMSHIWSVTTPRPSDAKSFVDCVSRHAPPMTFRIRSISKVNSS